MEGVVYTRAGALFVNVDTSFLASSRPASDANFVACRPATVISKVHLGPAPTYEYGYGVRVNVAMGCEPCAISRASSCVSLEAPKSSSRNQKPSRRDWFMVPAARYISSVCDAFSNQAKRQARSSGHVDTFKSSMISTAR